MSKKISALYFPALAFVFSASATQTFAKEEVKTQDFKSQEQIIAHYEKQMITCDKQKDNAREICKVRTKAHRDVAESKLRAKLEPTLEHEVDYRVAVAEAKFLVSEEKCESNQNKSDCVRKAELTKDSEIADARAMRD